MSAKVDNIEVPEASPDSNEQKQTESQATSRPIRWKLWIGLGFALVFAAAIATAIALPLSRKNNDKKDSNAAKAVNAESPSATQLPGAHQCFEPKENDDCTTQDSYQQCLDLANSGCKTILSTFSCPPQHRCGDAPAQLPEANSQNSLPPPGRCTRELAICEDGTPVGRSGPNCYFDACPGGGCPIDTYTCDDGTEVLRDPTLGCEFETCPENAVVCTADVKTCPDGSFVGRSGPNCEFEPCPVLAACTRELRYCADGTPVGRSGPNCHFEACPDGGCPTDGYICDDGTELFRDPALGCEFEGCPEEAIACTMDVKECPDGSFVGRSGPNCEFQPCPVVTPAATGTSVQGPIYSACTMELKPCPDGSSVGRAGPNCEFEACPEPVACTMDVKECPDGSFVGRSGPNCEFETCPPPAARCTRELAHCADGTPVGRAPPNCHFEACPDGACPIDTHTCDDGTELLRDLSLGCEFPACPKEVVKCTLDVRECSDGTIVSRSGPKCEFSPCPELAKTESQTEPPALFACTMELNYCTDGTPVGRTGPDCHFESCPDGSCPGGTKTCEDGTALQRDPALGCEFPVCEEQPVFFACTLELKPCPDGSSVGRAGPNCEFEACPQLVACTLELKPCPNGSSVGRVGPNCEFEACPQPVACTLELKPCPNGSSVGRVGPNCEFEECPSI